LREQPDRESGERTESKKQDEQNGHPILVAPLALHDVLTGELRLFVTHHDASVAAGVDRERFVDLLDQGGLFGERFDAGAYHHPSRRSAAERIGVVCVIGFVAVAHPAGVSGFGLLQSSAREFGLDGGEFSGDAIGLHLHFQTRHFRESVSGADELAIDDMQSR